MTATTSPLQAGDPHGSHVHGGHNITGMVIFLLSESIIFLAFFAGYAVLKQSSPLWLPEGVGRLEVREPLINTVILVSSSFVAYFEERALRSHRLWVDTASLVHGLHGPARPPRPAARRPTASPSTDRPISSSQCRKLGGSKGGA